MNIRKLLTSGTHWLVSLLIIIVSLVLLYVVLYFGQNIASGNNEPTTGKAIITNVTIHFPENFDGQPSLVVYDDQNKIVKQAKPVEWVLDDAQQLVGVRLFMKKSSVTELRHLDFRDKGPENSAMLDAH